MPGMDTVDVGPEAFADKDETVINYKGSNFYKACGAVVVESRSGNTTCVKRVNHHGPYHEDYYGVSRYMTEEEVNRVGPGLVH